MCQKCTTNKHAAGDDSVDTNGAYNPYDIENKNQPQDYDWSGEPEGIVGPPESLLGEMDQFITEHEPEAQVMNVFKPEIPGMMGYNLDKFDVSYDSFLYLSSFGYKYAQWQLSFYRGRILSDICDVYAGRYFTLLQLLDDAKNHAAGGVTPGNNRNHNPYYPPAPIFAQTHPNCLIEGTRVLTNNGIKSFDDLVETDLICSLNPDNGNLEYVKYIQKIKYHYAGEMVEFKNRGHHSIVTPNHRIAYRRHIEDTIYVKEAQDLKDIREFRIPRTGFYNVMDSSEEDVDTARVFGWFLSEGNVNKRKNAYQIKITQHKQANLIRMFEICKKVTDNPRLATNGVYISGDFAKWVYELNLGHSYQKYVPQFIKDMGKNALEAFLEEFALGDGHTRTRNCFGSESTVTTYYTSSTRLRDDIIELIHKVGRSCRFDVALKKGTPCKHSNGTYITNNDVYAIAESHSKNSLFIKRSSGRNKSEINNITYSGNVYCVELEKNGVFAFEYNGSIGFTGNCRCALLCIAPRNVQEIPLTAPGLPTNMKNTKIIHQLKKDILNNLKDEFINRWTFIDATTTNNGILTQYMQQYPEIQRQLSIDRSKDISEEAKKLNRNRQIRNWNRTQGYFEQPVPYLGGSVSPMSTKPIAPLNYPQSAEQGELGSEASPGYVIFKQGAYKDIVKPVEIKESIMYQSDMGLLTPLPKGYTGFLLGEEDGVGLVYILQLNHTIVLPVDILKPLNLRMSKLDKKNLYGGMYVYVDDAIGIAVNVYGSQDNVERAMIYLPEFQQLIEVDDWRILEKGSESSFEY